ncbi:uncharacterized protein LOC113670896 [Pocillopora damicornis]|uniref:uncharacterized protein LOC113670896 n=1 Tax=Pocillopora damicornis TaxID=46731 RepID=UPI000F5534BE|nr:uncharacterized protein LOC113670896 [Pocillopora damicornis]
MAAPKLEPHLTTIFEQLSYTLESQKACPTQARIVILDLEELDLASMLLIERNLGELALCPTLQGFACIVHYDNALEKMPEYLKTASKVVERTRIFWIMKKHWIFVTRSRETRCYFRRTARERIKEYFESVSVLHGCIRRFLLCL